MTKTDNGSTDGAETWEALADRLVSSEEGVEHGRMMSAEAVTYQGKVFAFRSTKSGTAGLGVRLGRDFDFPSIPTDAWTHLAPFKTKPPMKDWIIVADHQAHHWPGLANIALTLMREKQENCP